MQAQFLSRRAACTPLKSRISHRQHRTLNTIKPHSTPSVSLKQKHLLTLPTSSRKYLSQSMALPSSQPASSTASSPPPSPTTPTQPSTQIELQTPSGPVTQQIKRSYPQGKAEKLIAGLQHLLSQSQSPSPAPWVLSPSIPSSAIHRTFTISFPDLSVLQSRITAEADTLNHHPHISSAPLKSSPTPATRTSAPQGEIHVCAVTCTTHVPHGLSLKDVKLAERVEGVLASMDVGLVEAGKGESVGDGFRLAEELMAKNERAAEKARDDSTSVCNVESGAKTKAGRGDVG